MLTKDEMAVHALINLLALLESDDAKPDTIEKVVAYAHEAVKANGWEIIPNGLGPSIFKKIEGA